MTVHYASNVLSLSSPPPLSSDRCAPGDIGPPHFVFAFDAVAAIAIAMNAPGEDLTRSDGESLQKELLNVRFDGASGLAAFDTSGDRHPATVKFALESFGDPTSAEPLIPITTHYYNYYMNAETNEYEMAVRNVADLQWIGGLNTTQPEDAITRKVCDFLLLAAPRSLRLHTKRSNLSFSVVTHDAKALKSCPCGNGSCLTSARRRRTRRRRRGGRQPSERKH